MSDSTNEPTTDQGDEVAELRRRNADLQRQLDAAQSSGGWRMVVASVLVVLFAIVLIPANQAAWMARTVLETDRFVATFAPLPEDPAVADALGQRTAVVITAEAQIEDRIATLLGSDLAFVAAPIAGALEGLIADATSTVIQSDIFTSIWENALRVTHSSAIAIVDASREGPVGVTQEGQVVIDLNPLVQQVAGELEARGVAVIDTESIDATFVLYESEAAGIIQSIISLVYAIRWVAPIAVLVLLVAAIWVATDRRRVLSWLGIATIISGLVSLVLVRLARNELIGDIAEPTQQAGAEAAWDIVVDQLVAQTWALIILGLLAVLFAWFFGPSSRASNLRTSFMTARASSQEGREPNAVTDFLQRYGRILEWVVVALGVIFLLLVPAVRGWIVLITAIVVIGIVVAIEWIAGSPAAALPNGEGAESDRADEMAGS